MNISMAFFMLLPTLIDNPALLPCWVSGIIKLNLINPRNSLNIRTSL